MTHATARVFFFFSRLFKGLDPARGSVSGAFQKLAGRVGSGRVGSGPEVLPNITDRVG